MLQEFSSAGVSLETKKGSSGVAVAVLSLAPQATQAAAVLTAVGVHFLQDKGKNYHWRTFHMGENTLST